MVVNTAGGINAELTLGLEFRYVFSRLNERMSCRIATIVIAESNLDTASRGYAALWYRRILLSASLQINLSTILRTEKIML